jgi:uroporphyrinogen decarboxylase
MRLDKSSGSDRNVAPRERVERALRHQVTDRIPRDLGGRQATLSPGMAEKLYRRFGIEGPIEVDDPRTRTVIVAGELLDRYRIDTRWLSLDSGEGKSGRGQESEYIVDDWGLKYKLDSRDGHPTYCAFPLAEAQSEEDIRRHSWPETKVEQAVLQRLKWQANELRAAGYAVCAAFGGVWERSWYLRGFDRIFIDVAVNRSFLRRLLERILEIEYSIYDKVLEEIGPYLSMVCLSSDMGTQFSTLISPDDWRELIRPCEEALLKLFRARTPAKIAMHTCGAVRPLIPDYIEMGVEVLNPIQAQAKDMEPSTLKREFGKDLCFWGGIDTQQILPYGTVQEVKEHVRSVLDGVVSDGGYLFAPCQNVQSDVPVENFEAMYSAIEDYEK